MTSTPTFPPGTSAVSPVPKRGVTPPGDAATPYDRLPRTLRWAWWRPLLGLGVFAAAAILGSTLVAAAVMIAMVAAGELGTSPEAIEGLLDRMRELDATDSVVLVLALGSIAIWLVAVWLGLLAAGMKPLGHVSSVALRLRWGWLGLCTVVAVVTLAANFAISFGLSAVMGEEVAAPQWTPWDRLWLPLLVVILLVPFQAAAEEYVFRGIFVQALGSWLPRRAWARVIVWVLPTAAFVFSHGYGLWGLLDVTVFALTAMWVTLRTGGLEAAIALHVVNNVTVFGLLASGALGSTVNGSSEGSLAGVLITAIVSLVFAWVVDALATRRGIARTSAWPERASAVALTVPLPRPVAYYEGRVDAVARAS
ncbi:CPBP family intramembrane glutamic endopeptidase [Litorihabitans aurantiacus]|uniref:CAAX amino protease n=1 Tax=Litorihabitans aurantiacus TaxID=1930061 RepID=A0AA37UHS4_9MICO|nr:type II CAAX endopeptidase family protein [Litorihabitans aurantiacus]GMA31023.1 CAAX amino protease [Litorihabitans aurantiacus]